MRGFTPAARAMASRVVSSSLRTLAKKVLARAVAAVPAEPEWLEVATVLVADTIEAVVRVVTAVDAFAALRLCDSARVRRVGSCP